MKENLEKLMKDKNLTPGELQALIDQIKHPQTQKPKIVHHWGTRHIKIGLGGDLHIGSKYANQSMIEDVWKRWKAAGVDAIYLTGDITEGYNRRKGHSLECELHGADAQVQGVVERIPSINKPVYFITGDHDGWHWDSAGVNVGKAIEAKRRDMHFLGDFNATISLFKQADLMLVHPAKGTAYAISYQIQKFIESLSGGEKPSIAAFGHYHKAEYLFYRNVHAIQTGTFEDQTPWMKRMNISAHKAAWTLDLYATKEGSIDRIGLDLLAYYI